jgi:hypothetical protein
MKWAFLVCCTIAVIPNSVFAAVFVTSQVSQTDLRPGETTEYLVKLLATTSVNALEGAITFDTKHLSVDRIDDGSSVVALWVRKPTERDVGEISFSGIIPGGIRGEEFVLFRVQFRALATGTTDILWSNLRVLAHDGRGTDVSVVTTPVSVMILNEVASSSVELVSDTLPPEVFTPVVGTDAAVADGQTYIAFATTDKGAGVAAYYVREYRSPWLRTFARFRLATSPYILEDQTGQSFVEVKAVDYAGNERIVLALAGHSRPPYIAWCGVLALFALLLAVRFKKRVAVTS